MLWASLPRESRTMRRLSPCLIWGDGEYMLHSIEYSLRMLVWMGSKDAEKNRNKPKPWDTPAEAAQNRQRADRALANRSEIDEILGITSE